MHAKCIDLEHDQRHSSDQNEEPERCSHIPNNHYTANSLKLPFKLRGSRPKSLHVIREGYTRRATRSESSCGSLRRPAVTMSGTLPYHCSRSRAGICIAHNPVAAGASDSKTTQGQAHSYVSFRSCYIDVLVYQRKLCCMSYTVALQQRARG